MNIEERQLKFRTDFLYLCDKHEVSADDITTDFMNEVFGISKEYAESKCKEQHLSTHKYLRAWLDNSDDHRTLDKLMERIPLATDKEGE